MRTCNLRRPSPQPHHLLGVTAAVNLARGPSRGSIVLRVEALPRAAPASWRGRLQTLGEALGQQRHLLAVRDGVVGALPLVLAGSVFLLLAQPPSRALQAL